MAHNADTHLSVTSTIAVLRAELPELERHQQRLEAELAAVTGRLEAARDALRALQSLSAVPLPKETVGQAQRSSTEPSGEQDTAGAAAAPGRRRAAARRKAASPTEPQRRTATRRKAAGKAAKTTKTRERAVPKKTTTAASEPVEARKRTPGLSAGILAYLAEVKEPVRAAQVTQALGRETTPANVNAVRTSLERAVKASQAQRTGRGLYQALPH
ncbi:MULTISPECIES: hypothetical protein [Kitasatospora]|uniref:Prephenate dehydrogenase n=1 Tax=Kitasatospora cystarginea TaxID=58350 RepID=A0ABN3F090_9ACTN